MVSTRHVCVCVEEYAQSVHHYDLAHLSRCIIADRDRCVIVCACETNSLFANDVQTTTTVLLMGCVCVDAQKHSSSSSVSMQVTGAKTASSITTARPNGSSTSQHAVRVRCAMHVWLMDSGEHAVTYISRVKSRHDNFSSTPDRAMSG